MPKETFYYTGQTQNDGRNPDLTITWGQGTVYINGQPFAEHGDTSGLARLRKTITRALLHIHDHNAR